MFPYCDISGQWNTERIECKQIKSCSNVPQNIIPNSIDSSFESCVDLKPGAECNFSCKADSKKFGSMICLRDGTWSLNKAECRQFKCKKAPVLKNAANDSLKKCVNSFWGDGCSFECKPGFYKYGSLVCLENGSWSLNNAECKPIVCKTAPEITNSLSGNDCIHVYDGFECNSIVCNDDYSLINSWQKAKCLWNGTWDTHSLQCEKNASLAASKISVFLSSLSIILVIFNINKFLTLKL